MLSVPKDFLLYIFIIFTMSKDKELDLSMGTTLIAPEGDLFKTDGGEYTIQDYDIYSGRYTLKKLGVDTDRLKIRESELRANWEERD